MGCSHLFEAALEVGLDGPRPRSLRATLNLSCETRRNHDMTNHEPISGLSFTERQTDEVRHLRSVRIIGRGQEGRQARIGMFPTSPDQTKERQVHPWELAFEGIGSSGSHKSRMRTAYLAVRPSLRLAEGLCFFLLACASVIAQGNPQALVSKMVEKELESQKHPGYWMYLDLKQKPGRTELERVIQMPECWLTWLIAVDGHPPTEVERKHAREQLERLVNNADARKKNRDEIDADSRKSAELLKLLPEAFLFTRAGREGKSIRLKFRPNPKYRPSSNEARVFHAMEGVLLIDAKQTRLAKLSGELIADVDFGFGILGKLRKGGTFEVVQSQVAPKDWEVSLLDVHISGRALFFHSIGEQQREVRSEFKPVPSGISLAQAASIVAQSSPGTRP